jgi:hypothetical protein
VSFFPSWKMFLIFVLILLSHPGTFFKFWNLFAEFPLPQSFLKICLDCEFLSSHLL